VTKSSIYLIKGGSLFKIGRSKDINSRIKNLYTGSPVDLSIIHLRETANSANVESRLHKYFSEYRHHGEWFKFDERQLDWVIETIDNFCCVGEK
jgi:hypothetical protein